MAGRGKGAPKRRAARRAAPPAANRARVADHSSAAGRLYGKLLADILHGRHRPGARVRILPLADAYGTSSTTLREVLIRLVGDGLVAREASGFSIAPATHDDLLDLVRVIGWLEEIGVRESVVNGDRHWEEGVLGAHRALAQHSAPAASAPDRDVTHWGELALAFHVAIIAACRSPILVEHCRALQLRLLRYRNLAARPAYASGAETAQALEIRNALLARDAEAAIRALRSYYGITTDVMLASGVLR